MCRCGRPRSAVPQGQSGRSGTVLLENSVGIGIEDSRRMYNWPSSSDLGSKHQLNPFGAANCSTSRVLDAVRVFVLVGGVYGRCEVQITAGQWEGLYMEFYMLPT